MLNLLIDNLASGYLRDKGIYHGIFLDVAINWYFNS